VKPGESHLVTYASLESLTGTTSTIAIWRATLVRTLEGRSYVDFQNGEVELVGRVQHEGSLYSFDFLGTAQRSATPEYKAFDWPDRRADLVASLTEGRQT
jgi:hypothetical protein